MATEAEQIQAVLDSIGRDLTLKPRVVDFYFELGDDTAGDPAVFVVVVLAERTKSREWTSENLDPIAERVREGLRAAGVTRWPYVRFARPSELRHAG